MITVRAAATDAVFVGVALSDRAVDECGDESAGGRGRLRSEPRDRLSALASLPGGRLGGACGSAADAEAPAAAAVAGSESEILALRARTLGAGRGHRRRSLGGRPRRSGRCCAGAGCSRLPRPAREPVRPLRARASGRARARRHQEARPLLARSANASSATRLNRNRHAGWQYLHLAIDDHSRLAYAELLAGERPADCVAFLHRAIAWYAEHGITIERVLSDNGNGYRSHAWAAACAELGIGRRYTRPTRPDKRQSRSARSRRMLREWAYRFAYPTSTHRARALPGYLRWYNQHRPHGSLGGQPPISRVSHVCDYSS